MQNRKSKNFFNDADGFTKDDLEKLLLLILTVLSVVISLIMYIIRGDISPNMVYLVASILTATVARKGLSYLKPDRYYGNDVDAEKIEANNQQNMDGNGMYGVGMGYDPYSTGMYGNQNMYPSQSIDDSMDIGVGLNVNTSIPIINQDNLDEQ